MRYPAHEIAGMRFGRLVALECTDDRRRGTLLWLCRCDCGNQHKTIAASLVAGRTRSCGCLAAELAAARTRTHGGYWKRAHSSWTQIKQRCNNPNNPRFADYGGRGIKVCERWEKFETFFADMGERPAGFSIERLDNDKGYEPSNCKWASRSEQNNNRRALKRMSVEFNGEVLLTHVLAKRFGLHPSTISNRFKRGLRGDALVAPA